MQSESAAGGMMPLISDVPEVTQETKNRAESTKSDRVNSNLERKLQSIEARPTEVEGSEKRELVVEDAGGVRTMGSPKVDAVAGDAGSKGTPPDKVASSSSSSCKGGLDSGGSPAAPAIKSGSGSTRGDEGVPEGSPDVAGPPAESSSSAAPSVASHGGGSGGPCWDGDILHLLDDLEGVELFKRYLEQEQLGHYLLFYHFCQGFKETVESPAKLRKIVRMAHRDFIVGGATVGKPSKFIECLNQDVRSAIGDVVRNPSDAIDMHMFDAAQQQVLDFMRRTSYIKFFESDVYIQWLQTRDSSSSKPHSSASSVSGRQGVTESAIDQIAATGGSPRLHHRTLSQDVPQVHGEALKSANSGQQTQLPYDLVTVDEERELNLPLASSATSTAKASQPARQSTAQSGEAAKRQGQTPRLSQETLNRMQQAMGDLHPGAVGGGGGGGQRLLSSTAGAAAPYHAMSSTFNPTSRNDSEIQSQVQSDTTDNCSSFTEQSGSTFSANQAAMHRSAHSAAQMRRRQQKSDRMAEQQEMMRQARSNHRDTHPSIFNPNRAGALGPMNRNQELATKDPAKFFEKLCGKLQKVQLDRDSSAKLRERGVGPPPTTMAMSTSSRGAKRQETTYQHQLSQNYDPESDQSILDEHCSKVFDHTPVRGRSPPTERSKKVKPHKGSGSYMTWSKGQQAYGGFQGIKEIEFMFIFQFHSLALFYFSSELIFPPTRTLILLWPSWGSGHSTGSYE